MDISWTGIVGPITYGLSVAYGNGMWVAVGEGNTTIAYSSNGRNWTGVPGVIYIGRFVSYANGVWIVVGQSDGNNANLAAWSTDGINWNGVTTVVP
jgi:hypothetical protein